MLGKWVFLGTGRVASPPRLSSVFSVGCLLSWEQPDPASLYLSGNELCTGATVRVPTKRGMSSTSVTRAISSSPLPQWYIRTTGWEPLF